MTKLKDAREVLKGYYAMHSAVDADLEFIKGYLRRTPEEQQAARPAFLRWWKFHLQMLDIANDGEDSVFFPKLVQMMHGDDSSVQELHKQREKVMEVQEQITRQLTDPSSNSVPGDLLLRYDQVIKRYDEFHEAIFVPLCMQYFTREQYIAVERRYALSLGLSQLRHIMPWSTSRIGQKERDETLGVLPLFVRVLYKVWWEPAFKRKYQF